MGFAQEHSKHSTINFHYGANFVKINDKIFQ